LNLEQLEDRCLLSGNVILDWNATLLNSIATNRLPVLPSSRSLAMMHVAMYDAVEGIGQARYSFYAVPGLNPEGAPELASREAAATAAADTVLDSLYPSQQAAFDAQAQAELAQIDDGQPKENGIGWGDTVANAVLSWRSTDGSSTVVPYTPGTGPGVWQPTPPAFLPALGAQWPQVTPWAMTSGSQFRPPPPPALTSAEYAAAFNEVKSLGRVDSTTRTADQTQIALFWKDSAGTPSSYGHWNRIAEGVSKDQGLDLVDNARLFALLNIATADAVIVAWDAKYTYNFWRPVTAIQVAGDSSINPATVSDPTWTPLIVTPNFPSYTSGHSTASSAAATILTSLFGSDYAFSAGSDGLPGVTRSFSSFEAAAAEAGQSRIYGGIHFQFDNQGGLASGKALGQFVFQNFLVPVEEGDGQGANSTGFADALAAQHQTTASANVVGLLASHSATTERDGVDIVRALSAFEPLVTATSPTAQPPRGLEPIVATPVGEGQPSQRAPAPYRLIGGEAHRAALDAVFTDLDGIKFGDALRGEVVPVGAV
jgi:membrane-associated phospholipid phosphatase